MNNLNEEGQSPRLRTFMQSLLDAGFDPKDVLTRSFDLLLEPFGISDFVLGAASTVATCAKELGIDAATTYEKQFLHKYKEYLREHSHEMSASEEPL